MSSPLTSPGPIADRTYETGFKAAGMIGIVVIGACYWQGVLSLGEPTDVLFTLSLFPVYLLTVALGLGMWLGYTPDQRNLRPMRREDIEKTDRP